MAQDVEHNRRSRHVRFVDMIMFKLKLYGVFEDIRERVGVEVSN